MLHFKDILKEGYDKYKHREFLVWGIDGFITILSPDYLEELNVLGKDVLNFHAASQRWFGIADELGAHTVLVDDTRQIGAMLPGIHNDIDHALATELPACEEWTRLLVWPKMFRVICLVISRMIGGSLVSRDEAWIHVMTGFVEDLVVGSWELRSYSLLLRPIVARRLVPGIHRIILPIIKKRRQAEAQARATGDKYEKPNATPRPDNNVSDLCLVITFGALHTATATLTNVIFDLAARSEHVEPLREEYLAANEKYKQGWNEKQALLKPIFPASYTPVVLNPVTLSTGLHFPKDTHILIPAAIISLNATNYTSPYEFRGFRFHEQRTGAAIKCIVEHLRGEFEMKIVEPEKGSPENTIKGAIRLTCESLEAVSLRRKK
ncbi:cytochrome P450 [Lindgomyces ingoldianus]|uniref:Cytochrome P450 n=1 Tax=Lindgomyces ingoldianus TaxID=673940 RepID=A0ACB6Q8Q1_9PLEO|nr:cytochrome P450 [Lindgomyces ingoldianus]KAF2463260.1 cytochrome P450 [Lindgomyces ingoldianus]